jgi:hypothetical protein
MSELAWILVTGTIFKTAVILSGTACMAMGYKLFCRGVGGAADLKAGGGNITLVLRGVAPGTFFALFGATLVGITAWRGSGVHYGESRHPYPQVYTTSPGIDYMDINFPNMMGE